MKICTSCRDAEAVVFVQTIAGNKVSRQALCADCAARAHLEAGAGPLGGLMAGLQALLARSGPRARPARCEACGLSYAEFRQTGMLGCPACYDAFETQLKALIPRLHGGASAHRGD